MNINESYICRFLDEIQNIQNYVQYTENIFYTQYKNIVLRIEKETIKSLIEEFVFYTVDAYVSKRNQEIIKKIHIEIEKSIMEKQSFLDKHPELETPYTAETLKIIKEDYGLVEYLNPIYTDDSFEEYEEYLKKFKTIGIERVN